MMGAGVSNFGQVLRGERVTLSPAILDTLRSIGINSCHRKKMTLSFQFLMYDLWSVILINFRGYSHPFNFVSLSVKKHGFRKGQSDLKVSERLWFIFLTV